MQISPLSPDTYRTLMFQPPSSSAEAFDHAREMNWRRRKLDADLDAERAASRREARKAEADCPPSPDDENYPVGFSDGMQDSMSQPALSNPPSTSTIASSAAAENGGISQSTSHPSIPSVESGASSVVPDETWGPTEKPHKQAEDPEGQSFTSTAEALGARERPSTMPAGDVVHNVPSHMGMQEQNDGSSEDEGLTFGVRFKRKSSNPKGGISTTSS